MNEDDLIVVSLEKKHPAHVMEVKKNLALTFENAQKVLIKKEEEPCFD